MNKTIYAALFVSLLISATETCFIIGALIGIETRDNYVENKCLYTNRLELTKGRVMECRYLEGVTLK